MCREAAGELQPLLHSTSDSMLRKLVVASDTAIDMDAAQVNSKIYYSDMEIMGLVVRCS